MKTFSAFSISFLFLLKGYSQMFTDVSETSGISHYFEVYEGMFGGGVGILDFNNDGFEDIYLTGGVQPDQLLENNGDGTFTDKLIDSGLEKVLGFVTQGVACADFNRDGWKDIFITTITTTSEKIIPRAQNLIFINQGNGSFKEESKKYGIDDEISFSTGVSVGDFNLDGYPDLYVGNYFTDYDGGLKEINDATIVNAGKTARGYLYQNYNGKRFIEVSKKYDLERKGFSFGGIFTDFDNDQDMDIMVLNDFGYKANPNYLIRNNYPKKSFTYVEEDIGLDLRINAMGAATCDINGDGWLDYFITNIRFNRFMMRGESTQTYQDHSKHLGTRLFSIGWGANFADFDHDGDIDLFVANGDLNPNCIPMHNFYFENVEGKYHERSHIVGLKDYGLARGSALLDIENDGDMDLIVVNQKPVKNYGTESYTKLYLNNTAKKNFLKVKLHGTESTISGFGTRIKVYAQSTYLSKEVDGANSSHLSHNSTISHFGLNEINKIDTLKVIWPGGMEQKLYGLETNQTINIYQPKKNYPVSNTYFLLFFLLLFTIIASFVFFRKSKWKNH